MSVLESTHTCVNQLGNLSVIVFLSIIKIIEFPAHQESQSVSCLHSLSVIIIIMFSLPILRHPPNHSKCCFLKRTEVSELVTILFPLYYCSTALVNENTSLKTELAELRGA